MKKTKVEMWKERGFEFDPVTSKLHAPNGMWVSLPLVNGNAKIGKGAYHFSILPGNMEYHLNIAFKKELRISKKTGRPVMVNVLDYENPVYIDVRGTCICNCPGCYAMTGNYVFKTTQAYLGIRTLLARFYTAWLEAAIIAQIEIYNIKLCRIHAAGDFFSEEYARMWRKIAERCSHCVFWTYTKIRVYETLFDGLKNANIVKSVIRAAGVNGFNYGHCDYIMTVYRILKEAGKTVHICFCGVEEYAKIDVKHCTKCKSCSECEYVLFIEHSTSYKAQEDPLFPELVKLVLAQEDDARKAA